MELPSVRLRLEEWADFYGRIQTSLGYPKLSVEGRLIRDGGILPSGTKSPHDPMPINHAAEEIEAFWKELYSENVMHAIAVKEKYFSPANTSSRRIAMKLGLKLRTYQKRLLQGEKWFLAKLRLKKNISNLAIIFAKAA